MSPLECYENLGVPFLCQGKFILPVALLTLFWVWETWWPYFRGYRARGKHALHNLALALFNTTLLWVSFAWVTGIVAGWTEKHQAGLLYQLPMPEAVFFGVSLGALLHYALALLLLDGWMYVWHRANHVVPFLWRFHRMHHSDNQMDVTTATRFHIGEHALGAGLRLALVPLLGIPLWCIVVYDLAVIAVTQFHHANISLGRLDLVLRWLIVTPEIHKVHHSRLRPETDSNYSTVLSIWDRLARTLRFRADSRTIQFGLDDYDEPRWQTFWGMLRTPLRSDREPKDAPSPTPREPEPATR
ncbi:MAG: sterol desaturase family protein [Planctomycetia bacterium]|nr:sterol desaturase family protein [Planctomycetia bacterium]